jgi:methyltransferase (TIGR00027 family)
MEEGQPSRTAFGAAMHRAVHQLIDEPVLFKDPLAVRILGLPEADLLVSDVAKRAAMRAHIVARSLLAEGALSAAYERGVRQYVLLGAGFDTFAYRNPHPDLKVFEVDFPTSQAWKRQRLEAIGVDPAAATFADIDFERETLSHALSRAGFDLAAPAVFAWLGVMMYLTPDAVRTTFTAVGAMAKGSEIVFDYGRPTEDAHLLVRRYVAETRQRLADLGEPILTTLRPPELAALLTACGFSEVEDLDGAALNRRFLKNSNLAMPPGSVGHSVRARV